LLVKSFVRDGGVGFHSGKIEIFDLCHLACVAATILMAVVFFAGCETDKTTQSESNSIMQKTDSGHEVHGEVGAIYGASAR
jgi:uncharacterized lipoprotein YajG